LTPFAVIILWPGLKEAKPLAIAILSVLVVYYIISAYLLWVAPNPKKRSGSFPILFAYFCGFTIFTLGVCVSLGIIILAVFASSFFSELNWLFLSVMGSISLVFGCLSAQSSFGFLRALKMLGKFVSLQSETQEKDTFTGFPKLVHTLLKQGESAADVEGINQQTDLLNTINFKIRKVQFKELDTETATTVVSEMNQDKFV
jgi:hypothetical protein